MEDVSLEDLMAQLAQAQEAKSTVRLSERNVVELVSKLQSLGLLGADLLHTVDGRAYITKEQLTADVAAAVDAAGGRVGVADLPALLNADLVHCEAAAAAAVAASQGSTSLVGGDIISARYFDGVVADLAADLAARSGALPLSAACSRFQLAADTLTRVLEPALRDGRIDATLDGGVLTTAAAARRAKAALRGALRAAAAPVPLAPLAKALALEGKAGTPAGLAALVEELIADGAISGALRAGGASFAPTLASAAAAAATAAFYATNGYVEYAALARTAGGGASGGGALADAKRNATATFPDGTPLATVIAAPALLAAADAAAEEGAASGWADVGAALPPALTRDDAAALVAASPCAARLTKAGTGPGGGSIMAGTCVVTAAFVDGLAAKAVEAARREAETALAAKPAPKPDGAAAADKPKAKPVAAAGSDDDGDDWGTGKKGGGGKKKKKGGGGGGGGGKPKPTAKPSAAAPARATGATCAALSLDALEAAIGDDWAPGTADAGCGDDGATLATALAAAVRPAAIAEYDRVLADAASAGADARRRARDALVAAVVAAADRLQLYHRGAEAVVPVDADDADTSATSEAVARHLVRGPGADAGDALLRVMAADADEGGPPPPAPAAASLTPAARTALVAKLPADVRADAEKLVAALGGTDVAALVDALEAAAPAAGARVRRLDKKAEKALVADARRALEAALAAEADAAAALPLAACAALARAAGRAASVPGRALGALVAALARNGVPADDAALFAAYHADVVALLKARSAGDEGAAAAAAAKLADALPRLKAAAVGGGGGD